MAEQLRVLVVDDSQLMRRLITNGLAKRGLQVVGTVADGRDAVEFARARRAEVDVMSLDLRLPGLDGDAVLDALRADGVRLPTVVASAFADADAALDLLARGAIDVVGKPVLGETIERFLDELDRALRAAAASTQGVEPPLARSSAPQVATMPVATTPAPPRTARARSGCAAGGVLVIASSTGGPRALEQLLQGLPARVGAGTVIVQHMPAGFTTSLAARLDATSALRVREASDADQLDPGTALLAPGGRHLRMRDGVVRLDDGDPIGGLRPRADPLIRDLAERHGSRMLLAVLTGMGNDGLDGAREVHRRGGLVFAEDASTCTVYGMPRAVAEAGIADRVLPLHDLAAAITRELNSR